MGDSSLQSHRCPNDTITQPGIKCCFAVRGWCHQVWAAEQLKGRFRAGLEGGGEGQGTGDVRQEEPPINESCQRALPCRDHSLWLLKAIPCPGNEVPRLQGWRGTRHQTQTAELIPFMPSARFQSEALETREKLIY